MQLTIVRKILTFKGPLIEWVWRKRGDTTAMYVCVCNGLNERAVGAAIDGGAAKVADIYRANGCAPRCGKCVPDMRAALDASPVGKPLDAP